MKEFLRRTPRYFTSPKQAEQQIPDDLWKKCPGCGELTYTKQWLDNAKVCPKCGHHERMAAAEWIELLVDKGSWQEHDGDLQPADPLHFVSPRNNYAEKVATLQEQGLNESSVSGNAQIEEQPFALCVSEFGFMGGSMGSVMGEKIARAAERAADEGMALVTINASGGARMQEGILSLMQMAKTSVALARLGDVGQPHISILIDPCLGGVTASYASSADIILAEPGAVVGFAGRRVIEQTIRQKLPPEFQTAEFLLEHGMIDMVTPRAELRGVLAKFLRLYRRQSVRA
ncbi:MAG: acetyl-CoA carboxylase carboxyltransferase subunit beta [Herpetosiphonaceae bacterium]|nr:acetyl-CoA carboxylase carboxyltransferase subunit beta [Herpetosiphonaceae bacterium]